MSLAISPPSASISRTMLPFAIPPIDGLQLILPIVSGVCVIRTVLSPIRAAARAASIDEFITSLPNGYDTKVGELGDTLSSGEKQRLGIARAFLYNAPFILLDEPTSNLDSLNEGIILKALKEKSKGRTILLVSHRDSTMNIVDEMVEMG